jgi:hypothetical protein
MRLLEKEFLWFSSSDINQVFEQSGQRYAVAWRKLQDADANGSKAEVPLTIQALAREKDTAGPTDVQSDRLQAEIHCVRRWAERDQREYKCWADGLFFSQDRDGQEQLIDADGMQVMMEWEKPYMERCVDELGIGPGSRVLEIGFGCGYSAERIQQAKPKSHTIIECAEPVLERLRAWASERPSVNVVEGTWQERMPELGKFDHVFFDDYGTPGRSDREMDDACPDKRYKAEYVQSETHFHGFLNIVLRWHSHKGTRITGYLEHPIDMERNDVDSNFQSMHVQPPAHCHYWPGELTTTATVPLFRKRSFSSTTTEEEAQSADVEGTFETKIAKKSSISAEDSCGSTRASSSRSGSRSRSRSRSRRSIQ